MVCHSPMSFIHSIDLTLPPTASEQRNVSFKSYIFTGSALLLSISGHIAILFSLSIFIHPSLTQSMAVLSSLYIKLFL